MQLERCFTMLYSEGVSRDIELGDLDALVLWGWEGRASGNPGGVTDTGMGKKIASMNLDLMVFVQLGVHDF